MGRASYLKLSKHYLNVTRNTVPALKSKGSSGYKLLVENNLIDGTNGVFSLVGGAMRVYEKICTIIDHEMRNIDAQKIMMPCLSTQKLWESTGRWSEMGAEMFKFQDRQKAGMCLSPTNEETVTTIVAKHSPVSEKYLPIKLYQIGRKFRDEMRPKYGLLRCREFVMKDLYIFDKDITAAQESYDQVCQAYDSIFNHLNVPVTKVEGHTGTMGGHLSHEYHILSDDGEDQLNVCPICHKGYNQELDNSEELWKNCHIKDCKRQFDRAKGIEIAHAFLLGTKYTTALKALYADSSSINRPLMMSCFGIGVSRLIAAVLDSAHNPCTENIRWPTLIAPYQVCVIPQKVGYKSEVTDQLSADMCECLAELPNLCDDEVVLDDRTKLSIGYRAKDAKLYGYPYSVIVGKKSLQDNPLYEVVNNYTEEKLLLTKPDVIKYFSSLRTTYSLMH